MAKAQAEVLALGERKHRFRTAEELSQAVQQIIRHHRIDGLVEAHVSETVRERTVRGYGGREARVISAHESSVQVVVDEVALAQAIRELGWQVYVTNHPPVGLSLT